MIIPADKMTVESIRAIVESVIVRDGTDYGERELSLEEKVDSVLPQVMRGEVLVAYDEDSESVTLVTKQDAAQMS